MSSWTLPSSYTGASRGPAAAPRHLADCASAKPYGAPASVIESFDRAKALYIFMLVGLHQRFLRITSPENSLSVSDHLGYDTVDHGVELMMALMLISGWLSSATWKDNGWHEHMRKKVARLIPAYIVAVVITLVPVVLMGRNWWDVFEFTLEMLTLGGWNPALEWTSFNRPLWFISTLLSYHYVSPLFLPKVRALTVRQLAALYVGLYLLRQFLGLMTLLTLRGLYGEDELPRYVRVIHLWAPTQVWLPLMGAALQQLAAKVEIPSWFTNTVAWVVTDVLMVVTVILTIFVPSTGSVVWDAMIAYMNLLTGPFLTLLVVFMSVDAGTLWYLTTRTEEIRKLFGTMLSASYPLYLVHWPLVLLMERAGLFASDSWDSALGAWACCVLLSVLIDTLAVGPFTRVLVQQLENCRPRRIERERQSADLKPKLRRGSGGNRSAIMEMEPGCSDNRGLLARILALERSLYFAVNGGSALHAAHHPNDELREAELIAEVEQMVELGAARTLSSANTVESV